MKWLSILRLLKSSHVSIRQAEAEKDSNLCLLFAQHPNPTGRQQYEKRGKRVRQAGWDGRLV